MLRLEGVTCDKKMNENVYHAFPTIKARLDEAEAQAMKGGKRQLQKMEQRIRELETELDGEQRRHQDTTKNMRKQVSSLNTKKYVYSSY